MARILATSAPPTASPIFRPTMMAENTMAVARRLFFHSEKSATSATIDHSNGVVMP
jgi:hypothetical protein